jgi:hypothetical protein
MIFLHEKPMLTLLLCAILESSSHQPSSVKSHEEQNPIYKKLLTAGLDVGAGVKAKFPEPTMPDGLDAGKQKAVISRLIGSDYSYEEFTRKSVVAPQLLKLRDITPSDPKAPARGVDVWFVGFGDLKSLDDEKFVDRLINSSRGEGKDRGLTKADLAKRNITLKDEKREAYGRIEFDFLEKVRLKATGVGMWSRTDESFVIAAEIDPRFQDDPQFPNQWQSLTRESGMTKVGPPHPWNSAAVTIKITRLAEPAGALFIEEHIVFAEPTGWFEGANLLRSKLPLVVQNNVRNMRREWAKAAGK